jgi:hypothetical protein
MLFFADTLTAHYFLFFNKMSSKRKNQRAMPPLEKQIKEVLGL